MAPTLPEIDKIKWDSAVMPSTEKENKISGSQNRSWEGSTVLKLLMMLKCYALRKRGHKSVLSGEQMESELAEHCAVVEERLYGLESSNIHGMAVQLAIRNKLSQPSQFSFFISKTSSCVWRYSKEILQREYGRILRNSWKFFCKSQFLSIENL
jgi:hypothetical protein